MEEKTMDPKQIAKQMVDFNKTAFDNKVSELYTKYKTDGFVTYKKGNINMEKNTEFPIFVELKEGRWYQFVVIGDPEAKKLEMKLGLEGVGNIITDKFKTENIIIYIYFFYYLFFKIFFAKSYFFYYILAKII